MYPAHGADAQGAPPVMNAANTTQIARGPPALRADGMDVDDANDLQAGMSMERLALKAVRNTTGEAKALMDDQLCSLTSAQPPLIRFSQLDLEGWKRWATLSLFKLKDGSIVYTDSEDVASPIPARPDQIMLHLKTVGGVQLGLLTQQLLAQADGVLAGVLTIGKTKGRASTGLRVDGRKAQLSPAIYNGAHELFELHVAGDTESQYAPLNTVLTRLGLTWMSFGKSAEEEPFRLSEPNSELDAHWLAGTPAEESAERLATMRALGLMCERGSAKPEDISQFLSGIVSQAEQPMRTQAVTQVLLAAARQQSIGSQPAFGQLSAAESAMGAVGDKCVAALRNVLDVLGVSGAAEAMRDSASYKERGARAVCPHEARGIMVALLMRKRERLTTDAAESTREAPSTSQAKRVEAAPACAARPALTVTPAASTPQPPSRALKGPSLWSSQPPAQQPAAPTAIRAVRPNISTKLNPGARPSRASSTHALATGGAKPSGASVHVQGGKSAHEPRVGEKRKAEAPAKGAETVAQRAREPLTFDELRSAGTLHLPTAEVLNRLEKAMEGEGARVAFAVLEAAGRPSRVRSLLSPSSSTTLRLAAEDWSRLVKSTGAAERWGDTRPVGWIEAAARLVDVLTAAHNLPLAPLALPHAPTPKSLSALPEGCTAKLSSFMVQSADPAHTAHAVVLSPLCTLAVLAKEAQTRPMPDATHEVSRLVNEPLYGHAAWAAIFSRGFDGFLPLDGTVPFSVVSARQRLAAELRHKLEDAVGEEKMRAVRADIDRLVESVMLADISLSDAVQ
eukprot:1482061-Pleurochrysis_carterae.AAC.5